MFPRYLTHPATARVSRHRLPVRRLRCAALALVLLAPMASAGPRTLGWLEWSWLMPGDIKLKTKLDTGARTSSIDAVGVETFERDDEMWVRFRIPLADRSDDTDHETDIVLERRVLREVRIKDHHDKSRPRYVVSLAFCLGGITFETPVSLADRSRFNYPLLLGRTALEGHAVVDPARIFTASKRCPAAREKAEP